MGRLASSEEAMARTTEPAAAPTKRTARPQQEGRVTEGGQRSLPITTTVSYRGGSECDTLGKFYYYHLGEGGSEYDTSGITIT